MKKLIVYICCLLPITLLAQQTLSWDDALQKLQDNNLLIKASAKNIESQRVLEKSAFDLGKTQFNYLGGQYNSIQIDNNVGINQTFSLPALYLAQSKNFQAQTNLSELIHILTINEQKWLLKSLMVQVIYQKMKHKMLLSQDSTLAILVKASDLRYKTGETNQLEKISSEALWFDVQNQIQQSKADIDITLNQISTLIGSNEMIDLKENAFPNFKTNNSDTSIYTNHPLYLISKQQNNILQTSIKLEKAKTYPDVSFGYFSQTLIGTQNIDGTDKYFSGKSRFQGWQVSLFVPLWLKPFKARINSLQLSAEANQFKTQQTANNLKLEIGNTQVELNKNQASLQFYETKGLPQASLILQNAQKEFKGGQIGYLEYFQAFNRAYGIKNSALDVQLKFNQTLIKLQYLTGF